MKEGGVNAKLRGAVFATLSSRMVRISAGLTSFYPTY
jgi:hypothetical protein